MSGSNDCVVDTNVLIFLQNGIEGINDLLRGRGVFISYISEMELLSYPGLSKEDLLKTRNLLTDCHIIELNGGIKERAIQLRRKYRLKLPDSIVAATSLYFQLPLITADRDFKWLRNWS